MTAVERESGGVGGGHGKVAVIGAGPVGALQSILLAKRGFQVDLFDSRRDPRLDKSFAGRSINIAVSERGLAACRRIGLEEEVLREVVRMRSRLIHVNNRREESSLSHFSDEFSGDRAHKESQAITPTTCYEILYGDNRQTINSLGRRFITCLLLDAAAGSPGVTIYFSRPLLSFDCRSGTCKFASDEVGGDGEVLLHYNFIFACDGINSVVRDSLVRADRLSLKREYIDHSYKELCIPPTDEGESRMAVSHLHIWPRGEFMMIALPNPDKSFTATLFAPWTLFSSLISDTAVIKFFGENFPDFLSIVGEERMLSEFHDNPTSDLCSILIDRFASKGVCLMGDAAHAIVPFYGQGLNCGLEDCVKFDECLATVGGGDLQRAAEIYSETRKKDTDAILQMSLENYIEMRSRVLSNSFLLKRKADSVLGRLFPSFWIPQYTMVAFTKIPYSEVLKRRTAQDNFLCCLGLFVGIAFVSGALCLTSRVSRR